MTLSQKVNTIIQNNNNNNINNIGDLQYQQYIANIAKNVIFPHSWILYLVFQQVCITLVNSTESRDPYTQ